MNNPRTLVFDGHNDALHWLHPFGADDVRRFLDGILEGAIDLPKARRGGFTGGFFAVFASSPSEMEGVVTDDGYEVPRQGTRPGHDAVSHAHDDGGAVPA